MGRYVYDDRPLFVFTAKVETVFQAGGRLSNRFIVNCIEKRLQVRFFKGCYYFAHQCFW